MDAHMARYYALHRESFKGICKRGRRGKRILSGELESLIG